MTLAVTTNSPALTAIVAPAFASLLGTLPEPLAIAVSSKPVVKAKKGLPNVDATLPAPGKAWTSL